jgi:hypothetical protein
MHAIAGNAMIGTRPYLISTDRLAGILGARTPSTPTPPAGSLRAQRKVLIHLSDHVQRVRSRFGDRLVLGVGI